jgi:uncharacterized membrane protein YfcA
VLDPLQIAVACLAVAAGAMVQGSIGFGMALLSSPILMMVDPRLVPGPLTACGVAVSLATLARERRRADLRGLTVVLPGLLVGSWMGAGLLYFAPADLVSIVLGGIVLAAVALSAWGLVLRDTRRNVLLAGIAAGFLSTTASIPGPPLALVYHHRSGDRLSGTLAPIFLFSGVVSLINLTLIGRFGAAEIKLAFLLGPAVAIGMVLSSSLTGRLRPTTMRLAVLILSGLAGLAAIVRGLAA